MRFGVIVFPGTWSDRDCYHVLDKGGVDDNLIWESILGLHKALTF